MICSAVEDSFRVNDWILDTRWLEHVLTLTFFRKSKRSFMINNQSIFGLSVRLPFPIGFIYYIIIHVLEIPKKNQWRIRRNWFIDIVKCTIIILTKILCSEHKSRYASRAPNCLLYYDVNFNDPIKNTIEILSLLIWFLQFQNDENPKKFIWENEHVRLHVSLSFDSSITIICN